MKKALHIIKNIFVWLVVALAVCMMIFTIISVSTFDRTDRSLFGYKAFIVLSDSMSATDFSAGDLVLSQGGRSGRFAAWGHHLFPVHRPG